EGSSSCMEETPRSARIPCGAGESASASARSPKFAWTRRTRSPKGASCPRASASAFGSRSRPRSRRLGSASRSARAWPPAPTVASTKNPPRSAASSSTTSATRTGSCGGLSTGVVLFLSFRIRVPCFVFRLGERPRQLVVVLVGEVFGRQAALESPAIGDDQVIDVSRHHHVGGKLRGVAEDLRNEHATLSIDRRVLTVVVDALEKLVLDAMDRRQRRELLLERPPHG